MIDRDRIEGSVGLFPPPTDAFERLVRRRERRHRNQRLAAAGVGIAILLVGLFTGYEVLRSAEPVPREPTPVPTVSVAPTESAAPVLEGSVFLFDLGSGSLTPLPHAIQEMSPVRVVASPDGSSIAFSALGSRSRTQIFLADAEGTSVRQLTDDPLGAVLGGWSPDGSRIVYTTAALFERKALRVVEIGTGEITDLVSDPDYLDTPTFAPDGNTVLFMWAKGVPQSGWRTDLWTVPVGGGAPTRLIEHGGYGSYTPDGTQIIYRRTLPQPNAYCGICWWVAAGHSIVPSDGSEQPGPTEGGHMSPSSVFDKVQPRWAPDGRRFLFFGPSNRIGEFWVVDAETGERTEIGEAAYASWLDDTTLILIDPTEETL